MIHLPQSTRGKVTGGSPLSVLPSLQRRQRLLPACGRPLVPGSALLGSAGSVLAAARRRAGKGHCGQGTGPVSRRGAGKVWSAQGSVAPVSDTAPGRKHCWQIPKETGITEPRGREIVTGVPESLLTGHHACPLTPPPWRMQDCPLSTPDRALGGEGDTEAQKASGAWEAGRWGGGGGQGASDPGLPPESHPRGTQSRRPGQLLRMCPWAWLQQAPLGMVTAGEVTVQDCWILLLRQLSCCHGH